MSSLSNINNNSSVVNVGRTTPVSPGARPAAESLPVVVATDQQPIPVIEQQKIQSEVALSMLGIPRSEVALGIFSDVNTYDVNPTEWSESPAEYTSGWGVRHLPQEAGAIIQAPKDKYAILSSKRFFRYQPGRVSSATFGVKSSESPTPDYLNIQNPEYDLNPAIRKYGIFDKFDGYYWETRGDAQGDNFAVVRRTQSLLNYNPVVFSNTTTNQDDYRIVGKAAADPSPEPNQEPRAIEIIKDQLFEIVDDAYSAALSHFNVGGAGENAVSYDHLNNNTEKCKRDTIFALNAYILDLQYSGRGHTITNATTYRTAIGPTAPSDSTTDARRSAENKLHEQIGEQLKTVLVDLTDLNGVARDTRIDQLVNVTRTAVGNGSTLGAQPSSGDLTSTSSAIWSRNKIKTVFAIYKRYLGYLISEAFIQESGYTAAIKYKCLRDVGYIVDGYGRDLSGGGNAATVYNMKNFYFNNILQVTSTFAGGYSVQQFHIDAHTLLRSLISKDGSIASGDNPNSSRWNIANLVGWVPVFNLFGFGSLRTRFNNELASPLIANFTSQYSGRMDFGTEPQFGDLITLRDGLVHVHAAVYDPTLLKQTAKIRVRVNPSENTLEAADGEFVVDQVINFIGNVGGLVNEKFYAVKEVKGPLSNVISLYDIADETKATVSITSATGVDNFIEINLPFVFPNDYQKGNILSGSLFRKPDGMFPLMYTSDENLPKADETVNSVGFIDTALDTTSSAFEVLRAQIDQVNFRYNNWIKQNVDPAYYAVYEYRVPRSRFSTDRLDGDTKKVVYSDIATGDNGLKVRPGENVTANDTIVNKTSVWNIDLTKVTMLKVEFSWYGAVGALFLAYVPVSNDEARWVRVHHLRASNQLKISSLGNATLPITYITYGGGSVNKMGVADTTDKSYGSASNHVVKYGASYYIDGGDRGTVRLYSHSNLLPVTVYGKTYSVPSLESSGTDPTFGYYIEIPSNIGPADKTYFMKAQVVTSSIQDQNVQVIWVDGDRLYLDKTLASTSNIKLLAKRPSATFGLKAKESIFNSEGVGVRNRVQVYPTKLSTANFAAVPMTLNVIKTPVFQTTTAVAGTFELDSQYVISPNNLALPAKTASESYLANDGDETYGWFFSSVGPVFGRLYRVGGEYFFNIREVFSQEVRLFQDIDFLRDGRFSPDGQTITGEFEAVSQKERLSSVFISNVNQSPIPDTGSIITSFYLSPGSNQFDLLSYFDYNKDYLSFPLTDQVESIYLAASLSGESNTNSLINTSVTWEEQ
jgi:hypothetical protein